MLFYTPVFVVFSIVLLALLAVSSGATWRKVVLLAASWVFYMWWNPAFIALLLFSTALDYLLAARIAGAALAAQRKRWVIVSVVANLGVLAFFKYAGFLESNLLGLLRLLGHEPAWVSLNITLPVGISFYTFQSLSYTIDVYRGVIRPAKTPLDFALFVAFFPQLVAGPIVRAADFLPQLDRPVRLFFDRATGLLILRGLAKKVLVADNLAPFAEAVFGDPGSHPSAVVWLATLCFAAQIYCDFSGYSDIAIGLARCLGFDLQPNFDRPYFARNPREFWAKWHISLSTWLRDYLYVPLGGNREGAARTCRNIMITMLLGGLWHGASWNFVLWGLVHGCALVAHRALGAARGPEPTLAGSGWSSAVRVGTARLGLFVFVLATWIVFRVQDPGHMVAALRKFLFFDFDFRLADRGLRGIGVFSTLGLLLGFAALHVWSWRRGSLDLRWARLPTPAYGALLVLAGFVFYLLWPLREAPFIYFQF